MTWGHLAIHALVLCGLLLACAAMADAIWPGARAAVLDAIWPAGEGR